MQPVLPEDLLRQTAPLRRLALRLVADEARADDVVQETWLVLLRRKGALPANPLGWLAGVARNVALKMQRADARRAWREAESTRTGFAPSAEEVAERARVQRELTGLLLELDEPYRTALLYRYFEDLPPRAIAREMGAKVATVRAWLARGRERLRRKLTARHGSSSAWCTAFLDWARGVPLAAAPSVGGALSAVAAIGVVAGLFLALRFVTAPTARVPEDRSAFQRELVREAAAAPLSLTVGEEPEPQREDTVPVASPSTKPAKDAARDAPAFREPPPRARQRKTGGPPGLLLVPGGRTIVGTRASDAQALVAEFRQFAHTIAGEAPQHRVDVDDFYLMTTEVTNEQYAMFVRATGHRPPHTWASGDALEEGRLAFLAEEGDRLDNARLRGRPFQPRQWDAATWWGENWQGRKWEVPGDQLSHPVTDVNFEDAEAYARWVGLRLPTEFELQRAMRGNTNRLYPWGDEWDPTRCNWLGHGAEATVPVGSFPAGAVEGLHDLVGNVFEWTTSQYRRYPKYKELRAKVDGKQVIGMANFDPTYRVLSGGSFVNDRAACRVAARMCARREQMTEALGFRCAADAEAARTGLADWAALSLGVQPEHLDGDAAGVLPRWTSVPGSQPVEGYALITGLERVGFVPFVRDYVPRGVHALEAEERDVLAAMGYFDQATPSLHSVPLGLLLLHAESYEPGLPPGTYMLARDRDAAGAFSGVLSLIGPGGEHQLVQPRGAWDVPVRASECSLSYVEGAANDQLHLDLTVPCDDGSVRVGLVLLLDPAAFDASWE